jgi:hypothetical protein
MNKETMNRMSALVVAGFVGSGCQTADLSLMPSCQRIYEYGMAQMQEDAPNYAGPILYLDTVEFSSDGLRHRTVLVQTGPLTVRGDGRCFGGVLVSTSECVPLVGPSGERLGVEDLRLGMFASLWVSGVAETDPGQAEVYGLQVDSLTSPAVECYL